MAERDHRSEVHEQLELLAQGAIAPGEAAAWASAVMKESEHIDFDDVTWDALDQLAGADLLAAPGVLLHTPQDFADWLRRFEQGEA